MHSLVFELVLIVESAFACEVRVVLECYKRYC